MASYTTPKYGIDAPGPATKLKQLGAELLEFANSVDDTLATFDYNGADPDLVLARTTALESFKGDVSPYQDFDSGWTIDNTFDAAAGWSLTLDRYRRLGKQAFIIARFQRTGAALTVSSTGGVSSQLGTIKSTFPTPFVSFPLAGALPNWRGTKGLIDSSGKLQLTGVFGSANIDTGAQIELTGFYWIG